MPPNTKNKLCTKCKLYKNFEDFNKDSKRIYGLSIYCRECMREINKIIRKRNNKQRTEYNKNYRESNRASYNEWERNYYSKNNDKINQKSKKWRDCNGIYTIMHLSAKNRAKIKNLKYSLNPEIIKNLCEKQENKCFLTQIEFDLKRDDKYRSRPFAPSLDRIDNSEGYTPENVIVTCIITNKAKNEYDLQIFDKMCISRAKVLGL